MKSIKFTTMEVVKYILDGEELVKEIFADHDIQCSNDVFESNYAIAQRLSYNGEITVEDIPDSSEDQIAKLKEQLESTDYKIIKCSEAQLVGEELPYDIAVLHSERQALRDRINELESGGRVMTE